MVLTGLTNAPFVTSFDKTLIVMPVFLSVETASSTAIGYNIGGQLMVMKAQPVSQPVAVHISYMTVSLPPQKSTAGM